MSASQVQSVKGPRRSSRRTKNTNAGSSEGDQPTTDSGPSPPDTGYSSAMTPGAQAQADGQNQRGKPHGAKKAQYTPKPDRASSHRQSSPQPSSAYPSQRQGTPIKQAYAGPTFHASPAPSALPMPSFYSKSMPSIASTKIPDNVEESESHQVAEVQAEDDAASQMGDAEKRESTPLDFLFEAARLARDTPRAESPASRSANLSASEDSPIKRSAAPREGGETVFPFELDGTGPSVNSICPAFATPYKERISDLRSSSASPSIPALTLDEDERRNKTEALKKMLMDNAHKSAPRSASASPYPPESSNPFNARAPELRSSNANHHQTRHRSGPSTPVPYSNGSDTHQHVSSRPLAAPGSRMNGSPVNRPASSHLRRQYQVQDRESPVELAVDNNITAPPISTARKAVKHTYAPTPSSDNSSTNLHRTDQTPNHGPSHSAQQLEDDLRRVLKLNLTSKG